VLSERILFIAGNRIGDVVLATGLLAHLVETRPEARFTIACGPLPAPLLADMPRLERLHVMVKRKRAGHWLDLWRAMRGTHWATVIDLRGSAFAWTVRAGERLVYRAGRRRCHRVEELAELLSLATPPAPKLWVSTERDRRALAQLGGGPVLAIGPTANWGAKQWPAERFAEAATRLLAPEGPFAQAKLAVFGGPGDGPAARPLLDAVPENRRFDFIGMTDLLDCFAVLRHCSFYLGNDSGLMHMAAAAGIPTLGLFGPSPEWRYGPFGPHCAVVRTPQSWEELTGAASFDHRRQDSLMTGISVEAVIDGVVQLWSDRSRVSTNSGTTSVAGP